MRTLTTVSTASPAVLRFSSGSNSVTDMLADAMSKIIGWKMETMTVYKIVASAMVLFYKQVAKQG